MKISQNEAGYQKSAGIRQRNFKIQKNQGQAPQDWEREDKVVFFETTDVVIGDKPSTHPAVLQEQHEDLLTPREKWQVKKKNREES